MIRAPVEDMILSDGPCLPKDSMVAIPSIYMKDPSVYGLTADIFDGYRFLRLREQSGQENKWQFVTPSSEMSGFGFRRPESNLLAYLVLTYYYREKCLPGSFLRLQRSNNRTCPSADDV